MAEYNSVRKEKSESDFLKIIEDYANKKQFNRLADMFNQYDLPDKVKAEIEPIILDRIKVYERNGNFDALADLLNRKYLPNKIRIAIESALIIVIKMYSTKGYFETLDPNDEGHYSFGGYSSPSELFASILKRTYLPDAVLIEVINVCEKNKLTEVLYDLSKRDHLSKAVMDRANEAIENENKRIWHFSKTNKK